MGVGDDEVAYHVYVIAKREGEAFCSPVKVGITSDLDSRLRSIRTSCPHRVDIFYALGVHGRITALGLERSFHISNETRRVNGEWFDIQPLRAVRWLLLEFALGVHRHHSIGTETLAQIAPDRDLDIEPQLIAAMDAV